MAARQQGFSDVRRTLWSAGRTRSAAFTPQKAGKKKCVGAPVALLTFLRTEGRAPRHPWPVNFSIGVENSCGRGRPRSTHRAFTVIELLVVIAIVGVLAGLLLPALARAKQKGLVAKCASNLRQVYLLEQTFALDNDDTVPLGYRSGRKQFNTMVYSGTVDKFVLFGRLYTEGLLSAPSVLYCPAERAPDQAFNTPTNPWPPGISGVNVQGGYASRPLVDWGLSDTPDPWPRLDGQANMALLADGLGQPARVDSRHSSGVNVAFTDGSVKWTRRAVFAVPLNQCATISPACNPAQDQVWSALDTAP